MVVSRLAFFRGMLVRGFSGMTNSGRRNENADWMGSTARTKAAKAANDETVAGVFRIRVRDLLSYQAGQPPCQPRIRSEQ